MKTLIVVQARMTSTRLPGKVLLEVLGKPLLEYQIERLRRVKLADGIVVATTLNSADQPIIELCQRLSAACYRGSEDDVLARYWGAASEYSASTVVRITSDCPIIDPTLVDEAIDFIDKNRESIDYVANGLEETYPRGMDVEVFSIDALKKAYEGGAEEYEREHVTPFIYRHPEIFRLHNLASPDDLSRYRLTVDTLDDFELIRRILTELYPKKPEFSLKEIVALLRARPEWVRINAHVKQKTT